jgi:hypothetical protein
MEAGVTGQQQADQDLSEVAKTQRDILWRNYLELRSHVRHAETGGVASPSFGQPSYTEHRRWHPCRDEAAMLW